MTTDMTTMIWDGFIGTPWVVIALNFVCMAIGCFVVYKGVAKGIEKCCKFLIPALFIILVGIAVYAISLPGSSSGLQYLFSIDLGYLGKLDTWLNAFVQAAWSTGAGWGFIIVYSVYVREKEDIPNNCMIMGCLLYTSPNQKIALNALMRDGTCAPIYPKAARIYTL